MNSQKQEEIDAASRAGTYKTTRYGSDTEISLVDLWNLIAARKQVLFLTILTFLLLGGLYLVAAPSVYRVESRLLPVSKQALILLNNQLLLGEGVIEPTISEAALDVFDKHFNSSRNRRAFFDQHELLAHFAEESDLSEDEINEIFLRRFSEKLTLARKDGQLSVKAGLKLDDPGLAVRWLNAYLTFVDRQAVDELYTNVGTALNITREVLQQTVETRITLGKRLTADRIAQLEEAIVVARVLGLKKGGLPAINASDARQQNMEINTYNTDTPLYMQGEDALVAELAVLKARQNNEPFIPGLRALQERLAYLNQIHINPDKIHAVAIDEKAFLPGHPANKPVVLVMLLALVLGVLAGLFLVFLLQFLLQIKASNPDNS